MRRASRAARWSWVSPPVTREACGTPCPPTPTTVARSATCTSTWPRTPGSSTSWVSRPRAVTLSSVTATPSSPRAGRCIPVWDRRAIRSSGPWPGRTSRSTTWMAFPSRTCADQQDQHRTREMTMSASAQIAATPTGVPDMTASRASASEKTLLVLEAALTHSRFTAVVEATGLAKATTHRILSTLVDRQFVTVDRDGNYLPGPKILSLAGRALQHIDISAIAKPYIDALVERSHCTIHLGVVNRDEIIYLVRADSDKPYVMPSRVGLAIPMHSTGIGKVVLGSWADDELERFVARAGLPARTEHTITSLEGLRTEIADVRRLGYALDREENVAGLGCVAAPIRDHTGTVKYGISITTLLIEHTVGQIEAMSALAVSSADKISAALGSRA